MSLAIVRVVEANRGMLPIFRSTGMNINDIESRDRHPQESWRPAWSRLVLAYPGDLGP
jgi:hypothetical protein